MPVSSWHSGLSWPHCSTDGASQRQREPEGRALTFLTLDAHPPAMQLYNGLADIQAQPKAPFGATLRFDARHPVERLPHAVLFLPRKAGSLVAHRHAHLALVHRQIDIDRPVRRGGFWRVWQEVGDDPPEAVGVPAHRHRLARWQTHMDRALPRPRAPVGHALAPEVPQ